MMQQQQHRCDCIIIIIICVFSTTTTILFWHQLLLDGVKYSLKTCETILYELSVTGCEEVIDAQTTTTTTTGDDEPASKRAKVLVSNILPMDELEVLRQRMMKRDELREKLIKKCRDGQKAAKQAIYALHREDYQGAATLIDQCETCILEDLQPIVNDEPQLRYGSFANVLEEYAEAKLYQAWLIGKEPAAADNVPLNPVADVLLQEDFTKIPLEPQEYLGGLCDLTGEIGRFAVKRATVRDTKNVIRCMETNMSILFAMEALNKFPGNIGKKLDPLRRTVEKQERMLYELSLVEATGRNTIVAGLSNNDGEEE
jgi:predicted translin family RNA/ssDNA-binding protein